MNQKRNSLLTIAKISTITLWSKPVLNQVVLPAHAQTSSGSNFMPSGSDLCEIDGSGNSIFLESQASFSVDGYQFLKLNSVRDGLYEIYSPDGSYLNLFQFTENMCGLPIDSIQVYNTSPTTLITVGEGPYGPIIRVRRGS